MSWFVILGTVLSMLGCFWLIVWSNRQRASDAEIAESESHVWDENVRELNNPLPKWWLYLFVITIIFSALYLAVFPGLGGFDGAFGWSQESQYEQEIQAAEERYGPIFARYGDMPYPELVGNQEALGIGQSLFANYCSQCHGSAARGATGFPNLTDDDWLYGGQPENIEYAILNGRAGIMPALGAALGDDVDNMVEYVRSMADGLDTDSPIHTKYVTFCSACHGVDGKGNQALGAPNLTDDNWLYGSSPAAVRHSIVQGRNGVMPAHRKLLGEDRSRILAAYVYSLSNRSAGD
jgi:cytochrome c oxidase cbb3-type subunit 3